MRAAQERVGAIGENDGAWASFFFVRVCIWACTKPMLLHHFQEIFRDRIAGTFANYRIYAAIGANGRAESIARIVLDDPLGDLAGMKNFQTEKATADAVPLKPLHVVVAEFMGLDIIW